MATVYESAMSCYATDVINYNKKLPNFLDYVDSGLTNALYENSKNGVIIGTVESPYNKSRVGYQ